MTLSPETIARFSRRAPQPTRRRVRLTEADERRIVELHRRGFWWTEIGRKMGLTPSTVQNAHQRATAPGYRRWEAAKAEIKQARALRASGLTIDEVAARIGRSRGWVCVKTKGAK